MITYFAALAMHTLACKGSSTSTSILLLCAGLWYKLIFTSHSHTPYSCAFHGFLCVMHKLLMCHLTINQNNTPMQKNNISKFSECKPLYELNKDLEILLDRAVLSNLRALGMFN